MKPKLLHIMKLMKQKINQFLASRIMVKILDFLKRIFLFLLWPIRKLKEKFYDPLPYRKQKVVVAFVFLFPVLFGFVVFFLYPLVMSFIYSFSTVVASGGKTTIYFGQYFEKRGVFENPQYDLFHNYKYALMVNADFPVSLWQTAKATVLDTCVITIFSLLIAVLLNGKFKGRTVVRAIFFLPVILNSEAIDAAILKTSNVDAVLHSMGAGMFANVFNLQLFLTSAGIPTFLIGFLTSITGAIYRTIAYSGVQILIFLAAIQAVPAHLYEAAKIEGATRYESFWKITLPMVSPIIMTVVVYTVIDSFLRADINQIINVQHTLANYGYHSAMSWIYMLTSIFILVLALGILSKVVFYHDERT